MRLFIDECLSPAYAARLNAMGGFDATHPLHVGRRGEPDAAVLARCVGEDRVIVTENASDFRKLVGAAEIHPGLIILPGLDREGGWALLLAAIDWLRGRGGDPMDTIVNHVLEMRAGGPPAFLEMARDVAPPAVPASPAARRRR